jgi:hypothetical protein
MRTCLCWGKVCARIALPIGRGRLLFVLLRRLQRVNNGRRRLVLRCDGVFSLQVEQNPTNLCVQRVF